MAVLTGGELVVRTLQSAEVEALFGLHGAHLDPIFQACLDHGLPITDTRHEVAAGHAAEGYARVRNRLGVALATAGPGFTNLVTSIANAWCDRTPVLYVVGGPGHAEVETNTLQAGIDQVSVARPITKWAHRIASTADIPRLLAHAIRVATSGATGPVLVEIPADVLRDTIDAQSVTIPEHVRVDARPAPQSEKIEAALRLLADAERPVIVAGAGARMADAGPELRAFAEATGVPVYSDFFAHGLLPSDHPLHGGTTHKLADLASPCDRPDLVLALGLRFGLFTLGASDRVIPHAARIVHVEVDATEIGRVRAADVAIVADVRETLRAMIDRLADQPGPDRSRWQRRITEAKAKRSAGLASLLGQPTPPIHPYQAVAAITEAITSDTIVIGDGAEAYHWLNETIAQVRPGSYVTHGFLGAVGTGLGLAIGAQVAAPGRPVLCLAGDGAIGFTIAEFDTMVRLGLPIVVLVMNNRSWGASQHFQELTAGPNRVTGTQLGDARYHDVAAGFGALGVHVTAIDDLVPAIRAAFASGRPACINVEIDDAPIPPEVHLLMQR